VIGFSSYIFELHVSSNKLIENRFRMRIEKCLNKKQANKQVKQSKEVEQFVKHVYAESGSKIFQIYNAYLSPYLNRKVFKTSSNLPNELSGSKALRNASFNDLFCSILN